MKKKLVLITTLTLLVGILPVIWGRGYFLIDFDFAWQEIPFIIETKRMLASGAPWWTWNTYFGDNFIAGFSFYTLGSPFVWINCLFPDQLMLYGITFTLWLKLVVCALLTRGYLRMMRFSEQLSALGALLYSFSAFAVGNIMFYHFMEPMMCFPVFLMAIEHYLHGGRYRRTALMGAGFLITFVNFYFLPCSLLMGVAYALLRMRSLHCEHKWRLTWQAALLLALGVLMASVLVMPSVLHMLGAGADRMRGYSLLALAGQCMERLRTLLMPNAEAMTCIGTSNFNSNNVTLPLVGIAFAMSYVWRRRRALDWLSWLLIMSVVCYLTPLNGVFSLFTDMGYSRWAYALTLFIIVATLSELRDARWTMADFWRYVAATVVVVVAVYGASSGMLHGFPLQANYCVVIFGPLALSLVVLGLLMHRRSSVRAFTGWTAVFAALLCCCSQLIREGYADGTDEIRNLEDKYFALNDYPVGDGTFSYRTDFVTSGSNSFANQACYKNWPSVTTFSSVQNRQVIPLMSMCCADGEPARNHFVAQVHRTSLDALLSVKTVVDYHHPDTQNDSIHGLTELCRTPNYTVSRFGYYVPMGFTYDSYVPLSAIAQVGDKPLQLLAHLAVSDADAAQVARVLPRGVIDTTISLDSMVTARRRVVCDRFEGDTRGFRAHITLPKKNYVFFSVPADPGFSATVDGKPAPILNVNGGLSAVPVEQGSHDIEFTYFPPGLKAGAATTALCLLLLLLIAWADRRLGAGIKQQGQPT